MANRCAECLCVPQDCGRNFACVVCSKEGCCAAEHAKRSRLSEFFHHAKRLYVAALGIEILCIAAAEIGENSGLHIFGFNPAGIAIAYAMGYALAGLTTFLTILGRYNGEMTCGCCSVLEQRSGKGFFANLAGTMRDFGTGIIKLGSIRRQPNLRQMLKSSVMILVTAESACILTAETVDLMFYQYSLLLSVPLALLAGAFTVVVPEAYRKIKARS
jgi:hypothetical protein